MRRRAYLATAAAVTAPLVAGCGGGSGTGSDGSGDGAAYGGDGGSTTSGGGGSTADGSGGSDGQSAHPNYNWDQLSGADPTQTSTVTMSGFEFQPLVARVSAGTGVTFTNEDSAGHTVTIPALDVDEQVGGGGSTTVTVESAGTYDYVCALHPPDMLGRLVVE